MRFTINPQENSPQQVNYFPFSLEFILISKLRSPRKVRDSLKNHILRLCLVHPKIQFTLREENMFRAKPASSLSSRISDMFGDESRNSLQKIDFAKGSYRLAGYISKEIKAVPVFKTPLHKVLSSWPTTQWESIGNPAFVLNLVCPLVEYDITIDASKSYVVFKAYTFPIPNQLLISNKVLWKPVLAFAEEIIRKLWDARESNPRPVTNRKPEAKRKRELTEYADDTPELPAPKRKTSKTVFARRSSSAPPFCKPRRKLASYGISDDISISYDDLLKQNKTRKLQTIEYQDQALCKWRQIPIRPGQNTFASIEKPILQIGSGSLSGSSFQPGSITKEMLLGAKVLGQVDRKFIAAVTNGVLFFIDQHAADERVRLEEFRDDVFSAKEGHRVSLGDNAEDVALTRSELDVLATYRERIEYWGWCSTSVYSHGRSSEMCTIVLTTVPCIKGVKLTSKDLLEYIRQLADTHGSSSPPPAVLRVLNFKACRGAIMFGDFLLRTECEQLVNALKKTSLCFQCAHGRPTMVPIVNLETVRRHRWQSPRNGFQLPAFRNKASFPGRDFPAFRNKVFVPKIRK